MQISRKTLWIGRVLAGLPLVFLTLDGVAKLIQPEPVVTGTLQLGYPVSVIFGLGLVLLGSVILYAIPRTSIFGAILLTAYLGGAVATHVRVSDPLLTHTLFPTYFAILLWASLYLRNPKLRALVKE
jgi:hypothetical protein